jgi:Protein of unknown function (DUF1810)
MHVVGGSACRPTRFRQYVEPGRRAVIRNEILSCDRDALVGRDYANGPDERLDLERFLRAQACTYEASLAEIRRGRKRTHWMW